MDTKQIEYILKIAEEHNITRAAEKLFITQSALNQQLLKLEKELGIPLFIRSRSNCYPTEAGKLYLINAKKMLQIKKETYKIISDMAEINNGTLIVGFTPGRGIQMFTSVYPKFHEEYPNIKVEPIERSTLELQTMISDQSIDIAFVTLMEEDKNSDCYIDLIEEEILLGIPKNHPLSLTHIKEENDFSTLDLNAVKEEPFVLMNKSSTMRSLVNTLFREAGFEPKILFETRNNDTILKMIKTNLCCGLIPSYYVKRASSDISFFHLPSHPNWKVAATYKKDTYLNNASKYFIELVKNIWNNESY